MITPKRSARPWSRLDPVGGECLHKADFLQERAYSVAFTCDAMDDHPETHETIDFSAFSSVRSTARQEGTYHFR